jgi:MFS transporter, PCFT/HCP family, solute carrier family 46, member 3
MISKQVPADELGQVFSVLASLESIVPLMSSSTYNLVYEATLEWFPGCVYLVEAVCSLVIIILLM